MTNDLVNIFSNSDLTENEKWEHQKKLLALDSLSMLVKQFSAKPELDSLLNSLLLTISGQFAVSSAFIYLLDSNQTTLKQNYVGSGMYRNLNTMENVEISDSLMNELISTNRSLEIEEMKKSESSNEFATLLSIHKVSVIVPLVQNNQLLGIAGLSKKVSKKQLDDSELRMLSTIAQSVTPFIANTFLFLEISNISSWYHDILNSVSQGVLVFDQNGKLRETNHEAVNILSGFNVKIEENQTSRNYGLEDIFSEEYFKGWVKKIKYSSISDGFGLLENMVARIDEYERIYNISISPISSESQERNDTVVTLTDVTDQKISELHLFELQKFADKGLLASSIAHELNNFLALFSAGVEITEMNIAKDKIEKAGDNLSKLKQHVDRMARYTAGLMDYTRLDTRKELNNLNEIIIDVLSFINVQKKFNNLTITTDLSSDISDVNVDKDQISQLLLNLLNNASDAIEEAHPNQGEIIVKTYSSDNSVILQISDNGIGMRPEIKDQLFKVHLTTKKDGHGYGLVTCAKIVKNHNIEFDIESELEKGTSFKFNIPAES